jgi:hypothetical protein
MDVSGQVRAPAALTPGKEPLLPFGYRFGGPQSGLDAVVERKVSNPSKDKDEK